MEPAVDVTSIDFDRAAALVGAPIDCSLSTEKEEEEEKGSCASLPREAGAEEALRSTGLAVSSRKSCFFAATELEDF
jgi:hypothetical protein